MRKLLNEISVIPGVTGSCIFDKTEGALCTVLDADLPKDLTESVGIHFVRLVQMGAMNKLQIKSAHFRFDRYTVVGMPLDSGAILLTICEAQANCSLVATTAAMLAADLRDELDKPSSVPRARGKQDDVQLEQEFDGAAAEDEDLSDEIEAIEHALAGAIGPVAGMILPDHINKWRQGGAYVKSRLPELVEQLVEEIGDVTLSDEFKKQIGHLL